MSKCFWRCGDTTGDPGHGHYAVLIRENGRLLGRLTPDGTATNRKIHSAVMSAERANDICTKINAAGEFNASVIKH